MTVKEFLASIDPVEENWKTLSPGHWQNTVTGTKYDSTDVVQATIDAYNWARAEAGKGPFVPGITPVPDDITVTPGGTGGETGGTPSPRFPGGTDGLNRTGTSIGGGITGGGRGTINPNYMRGSTWNNPAPIAPRPPPTGSAGFGGGLQWTEPTSGGSGGPYRTGQAMPFSPYGTQQQLSSEILRYGGRPNSGAGGSWGGTAQAAPMQEMFAKPAGTGATSAGALDPWDIYNSAITNALRNGTSIQSRPTSGEAYQNTTISDRDGERWKDPRTGQDYVFRNGQWAKTDTTNRTGPVVVGPTGPGDPSDVT